MQIFLVTVIFFLMWFIGFMVNKYITAQKLLCEMTSLVANQRDVIERLAIERADPSSGQYTAANVSDLLKESVTQTKIWQDKYNVLVKKAGGTFVIPPKMDVNEFDKKTKGRRNIVVGEG